MELKPVVRAQSIIQRDAILAALSAEGIEAISPPRDISRKVADTTVDLAYEGYSAIFDGFVIQVKGDDFARAQVIAQKVIDEASVATAEPGENSYLRRFYYCGLMTLCLPGLMHALAFYYLVKGLKAKEHMEPFFGASAIFVMTVMMAIVGWSLAVIFR